MIFRRCQNILISFTCNVVSLVRRGNILKEALFFAVDLISSTPRVPTPSPLPLRVAKTGKNHLKEDMQRTCADVNSP